MRSSTLLISKTLTTGRVRNYLIEIDGRSNDWSPLGFYFEHRWLDSEHTQKHAQLYDIYEIDTHKEFTKGDWILKKRDDNSIQSLHYVYNESNFNQKDYHLIVSTTNEYLNLTLPENSSIGSLTSKLNDAIYELKLTNE